MTHTPEPQPASPFRFVRTPEGLRFTFDVHAQTTIRQRKRGYFGEFQIDCDEGPGMGDNSAPPPLAYFAAGLAF